MADTALRSAGMIDQDVIMRDVADNAGISQSTSQRESSHVSPAFVREMDAKWRMLYNDELSRWHTHCRATPL